MNVSPATQKIIASLVIIAGLGYVAFSTLTAEVPVDTNVIAAPIEGEEILILADKLNAVDIKTSIFESPIFTSLIDISIPIIEESKGRVNPFSQIGNDSITSGSVRIP